MPRFDVGHHRTPNPTKVFANQYWQFPESRFPRTEVVRYDVMEVARQDADTDIATPSNGLRIYELLPRLKTLCFSDPASHLQPGLRPSGPLP